MLSAAAAARERKTISAVNNNIVKDFNGKDDTILAKTFRRSSTAKKIYRRDRKTIIRILRAMLLLFLLLTLSSLCPFVNAFYHESPRILIRRQQLLSNNKQFKKSISCMKMKNNDNYHEGGHTIGMSRSAFLSSSLLAVLATTGAAAAVTEETTDTKAAGTTATNIFNSNIQISKTDIETDKTNQTSNSTSTLEESISGFIAGAALATSKTIVKYPLDTATVRIQMPNSEYSILQPAKLFNGCFRGIATPLICNIPAGAVFFAVKDATKEFLKSNAGTSGIPKWGTTSIAVLAATFPYMLVRNPSEVIKTRQQAGIDGYGEGVTALEAFQKVKQGTVQQTNKSTDKSSSNNILGNFYVGYWENVAYTYPADVLKFVCYENLSGGRKNLPPLEGAVYGAAATAIAQLLTTPFDVVRNRVMAGKKDSSQDEFNEQSTKSVSYVGSLKQIAKEEGLAGLFAGSSPRVGKAVLSGAIQFATYEETKRSLANFFQRR